MSEDVQIAVEVGVELPLGPSEALGALLDELETSLERAGMVIELWEGGRVTADGTEVGTVAELRSGSGAVLRWRAVPWEPEREGELRIRVEPKDGGSRLTLEQRGWVAVLGSGREAVGWFAAELAAPFLRATSPLAIGDWITDRRARRPSGAESRATYADPLYHRPTFAAMLAELQPGPGDHLLDVGCGGGAFLRDALARGCLAAGVDHSPEMVRLARETNDDAVAAGRLDVRLGTADSIPFPDDYFTCATMHGVLGFLESPVAALSEMRRVLRPGGRIMVLGSDPAMRGTPAAPEPMASRMNFYSAHELAELGRRAGFEDVRVEPRPVEQAARDAGVPEEHLGLFAGPGPEFLLARKGA